MKTEDRWHYKGKYRGLFRLNQSGNTHAATFYDLKIVALEIREVIRIPARDPIHEKTGDFHFIQELKPRSKWGIGGVDLVIIKDDSTAFSERIHDVILLQHSKERRGFSPIRGFESIKTTDLEHFVEGVVYFSVPGDPPVVKAPIVLPVPQAVNVSPVVEQNSEPAETIYAIPNLVSGDQEILRPAVNVPLQERRGCFNPLPSLRGAPAGSTTRTGCLNAGGCLGSIFRILRWLFIIYFILKLFGWVSGWLSDTVTDNRIETEDGNVRAEKPRLDPKQDTMLSQPWNYLVDHHVQWSDFGQRRFDSRYSTSTLEYEASNKRHASWANAPVNDELLFYHDLYQDMYQGDSKKLDSLVFYFDAERRRKNLDPLTTAEMVVTFVQEIPYVLVHDETCRKAVAQGGFVAEYHAKGLPCLANVFAGVQTPYEFAHNLKGDCDTRSLLAFTLLDRLDIAASVWISREYGHSILGVAVPANSPNYKKVSGMRYFATELTAKGFRVGMIAPEHNDMDNWNIVLTNR